MRFSHPKRLVYRLFPYIAVLALTARLSGGVSAVGDTDSISVLIETSAGHMQISPYIYGLSAEGSLSDVTVTSTKHTGAALSSYNWEVNFSNSGIKGNNANDMSLIRGYAEREWDTPALNTQMLVSKARRHNIPARFVTLQMMGLVAGDSDGAVTEADRAERFETVKFSKNGEYLTQPDRTDGAVYMDEYVSFLVNRYGRASAGGVNGYFLDYEPENWAANYPVLSLEPLTAAALVGKSEELAAAVKRIDRTALVSGPSVRGLGAYVNLNNPDDRESYLDSHGWFINYYLDNMKAASDKAGTRLLDMLDLHYITEANDSLRMPVVTGNTVFSNSERMQAPRLLWDGTYTENSVSAIRHKQYTPIIPTVQASIRMYYPGTRLSFSEYNFGGGGHISGGIAQADALGIFASQGVYMACLIPNTPDFPYQKSAINLYTNYDGNGASFGNTAVRASNGGDHMSSVYASIKDYDESRLKTVIINKNAELSKRADIRIISPVTFDSAAVYSINSRSSEIRRTDHITEIEGNSFTYMMEPLTIYLFVMGTEGEFNFIPPQIVTAMETEPSGTEPAPLEDSDGDLPADTVQPETSAPNLYAEHAALMDGEDNERDNISPADKEEDSGVPLSLKIVIISLTAAVLLGIIYTVAADYRPNKQK